MKDYGGVLNCGHLLVEVTSQDSRIISYHWILSLF